MPPPDPTYYALLGVPESADLETIRRAYTALILKWHPDVNPEDLEDAHERAVRINEAWEVLEDPAARREYDEHLRAMRAAAAAQQAPPPQPSSSASRAPGPPPFADTASERPTQEWSAIQTAPKRSAPKRSAPKRSAPKRSAPKRSAPKRSARSGARGAGVAG